jgi:hypothetical protein
VVGASFVLQSDRAVGDLPCVRVRNGMPALQDEVNQSGATYLCA